MPAVEVESAMAALAATSAICGSRYPRCGAVNTFPGWTSMAAFVCSECGQAVTVEEAMHVKHYTHP